MRIRAAVALLAMTIPTGASVSIAQTPAPTPAPERVAFDAFSERLVGTWDCSIKEYAPSGAVKWSDEQIRVFSRGFFGNALEEKAFKPPRLGTQDYFGLTVLLLHRPGYRLTKYGIWPGSAGQIFITDGLLRKDGSGFDGTSTERNERNVEERRRVVVEWTGPQQHVLRVYRPGPDGREYLHEELVYKRRA